MLRLAKRAIATPASSTACWKSGERLLGALLIGNNVGDDRFVVARDRLSARLVRRVGVVYASVAMTVLSSWSCEMLPKTAAINAPDRYALAVARPIALGGAHARARADGADWLVRQLLRRSACRSAKASRCCPA